MGKKSRLKKERNKETDTWEHELKGQKCFSCGCEQAEVDEEYGEGEGRLGRVFSFVWPCFNAKQTGNTLRLVMHPQDANKNFEDEADVFLCVSCFRALSKVMADKIKNVMVNAIPRTA